MARMATPPGQVRLATPWLLAAVLTAGVLSMGQLVWAALDDRMEHVYPAPDGPVVVAGPVNSAFAGLTTFRGNLSRSYYGEGPVPQAPEVRWRAPLDGSTWCSLSAEGRDPSDTKEWCGTGWTGQPNVVSLVGGGAEVREGAFDRNYHFQDGESGAPVRPDLLTGDLAKGSATTDPDNYPLYYAGSRDNQFRIVALDRPEPTVLWQIDANDSVPRPLWNDDWDGAALVVDGYLLEGGENGWLYVIRLNRGRDADGLVTVDPQVVATIQGFDDQLLADIGDEDVSIESSVAFRDGVVYFANSGGLVQGWDISDLLAGGTEYEQVFRFWTGDDTDASVVIDEQGFLYVASEWQRFNERGKIGQLMKLDPRLADDPIVWIRPAMEIGFEGAGGSWSTPALYGDYVYFTTAAGRVLEMDRNTGDIAWEIQIGSPAIGSPVVVDGMLLQGDCTGHLYAWDVSDPTVIPPLRWNLDLGDCIESTPAVWRGWLYVGTREGYLFGITDPTTPRSSL
jgi:outer membrane protein assembly factor BamB